MACHCDGCQRMTASAFSLSALVPSEGFEVTKGEPVIGGLHGVHKHYFCSYCMSWMFTRPDGMDWIINVRATLFDDTSGLDPFLETYTSEKLPWATTPAIHSFPEFPELEDYTKLVEEFAALRTSG
tara:strand:- start:1097 stop:1474 length:378 start_codon:yes stop_codon:yes gene_type:complete